MFKAEGYKLMGNAIEVYKVLGYGMVEAVCQQSLEIELLLREIPFQAKHPLAVHDKHRELRKKYEPGVVVFDGIVVKLRAVSELVSEDEVQVFNYLTVAGMAVGYLINLASGEAWNGSGTSSRTTIVR